MHAATRRELLALGLATALAASERGLGSLARAAARQRLTEADLLQFDAPMWDILERHIAGKGVVRLIPRADVKVLRS